MDILGLRAKADVKTLTYHAAILRNEIVSLRDELDAARTKLHKIDQVVSPKQYDNDGVAKTVRCYLEGVR